MKINKKYLINIKKQLDKKKNISYKEVVIYLENYKKYKLPKIIYELVNIS